MKWLYGGFLVAMLLALLGGCGNPTPATAPTPEPKVQPTTLPGTPGPLDLFPQVIKQPEKYLGQQITVEGVLEAQGEGPFPRYYLRGAGRESLEVSAWLPFEVVQPPDDGPVPKTMGDFVGRRLRLTGTYSTHGWPLIMNSGFPTGVTPHGGSWLVWLGGDYSDISYIQQQATVPSATPYLAYWHWIASQDVCGYDFDFAQVRVNGTVVDQYDLCSSANTGGWVLHVVGLHAYVGQSVALQIRVETDDSLNSNLFVDDVSFQATPLSGPMAQPVWDGDSARPRQ